MASETITKPILDALALNPAGMTAKHVAHELGWKATKASQVMGVMFFGQVLDRRIGPGIIGREFVYTIKVPSGPPAPTPASLFPPRLAVLASEADALAELEQV